jgi:hypothetical protein
LAASEQERGPQQSGGERDDAESPTARNNERARTLDPVAAIKRFLVRSERQHYRARAVAHAIPSLIADYADS